MFERVGIIEMLVIVTVGLFVFGPRDFGKYARMAGEFRRWFRK